MMASQPDSNFEEARRRRWSEGSTPPSSQHGDASNELTRELTNELTNELTSEHSSETSSEHSSDHSMASTEGETTTCQRCAHADLREDVLSASEQAFRDDAKVKETYFMRFAQKLSSSNKSLNRRRMYLDHDEETFEQDKQSFLAFQEQFETWFVEQNEQIEREKHDVAEQKREIAVREEAVRRREENVAQQEADVNNVIKQKEEEIKHLKEQLNQQQMMIQAQQSQQILSQDNSTTGPPADNRNVHITKAASSDERHQGETAESSSNGFFGFVSQRSLLSESADEVNHVDADGASNAFQLSLKEKESSGDSSSPNAQRVASVDGTRPKHVALPMGRPSNKHEESKEVPKSYEVAVPFKLYQQGAVSIPIDELLDKVQTMMNIKIKVMTPAGQDITSNHLVILPVTKASSKCIEAALKEAEIKANILVLAVILYKDISKSPTLPYYSIGSDLNCRMVAPPLCFLVNGHFNLRSKCIINDKAMADAAEIITIHGCKTL